MKVNYYEGNYASHNLEVRELSLCTVVSGRFEVESEDALHQIGQGDSLIVNIKEKPVSLTGSGTFLHIQTGPQIIAPAAETEFSHAPPEGWYLEKVYLADQELYNLAELSWRLAFEDSHSEGHKASKKLLCLMQMKNLTLWLETSVLQIEKPKIRFGTSQALYRAKDYIDARFQEKILIDDICKRIKLSRYHFIRLFDILFEETPHQYLVTKRLNLAKKRLREDSSSLLAIAIDSGFSSSSQFSRTFRLRFSEPPSEWRKRVRQMRENQI